MLHGGSLYAQEVHVPFCSLTALAPAGSDYATLLARDLPATVVDLVGLAAERRSGPIAPAGMGEPKLTLIPSCPKRIVLSTSASSTPRQRQACLSGERQSSLYLARVRWR
jgi:hypothetical protein